MRISRVHQFAFALLALPAACRESTAPKSWIYPIQWIEWAAAVVPGEPVALRVSAPAQCGITISYGVSVSATDVHVTATARGTDLGCPELTGTGAGYDTLLTLPTLSAGPGGLPTVFNIWATVSATAYPPGSAYERKIGQFTLQFPSPDTTPRFAGNVILTVDSLGCWRAIPQSAWPEPHLVFVKPLSLVPDRAWWDAFLYGSMVAVSPPVCGNSVAIEPAELDVDLASSPYGASPTRH